MRPVRLTFAGLRSYRASTEIVFDNLDLFAIIGDTGAGKSTIIEALSLVLYGRKTWSGGAKLEDLIADGEKAIRIEFTFEADGHQWTVTRSWNRSATPGISKLRRTDGSELVDGSSAVTARVTELLGLDHAQFTQAVVIPQGRFDELLKATPAQRNKLLTSILGLDDVRKVASEADGLRRRWQSPLAATQAQRDMLPVDPVAEANDASEKADLAETRRQQLDLAIVAIGDRETTNQAIATAIERIESALAGVPAAGDTAARLEAADRQAARLLLEQAEVNEQTARIDGNLTAIACRITDLLAGFASRDEAVTAATAVAVAATALLDGLDELKTAEGDLAEAQARPVPEIDPALAEQKAAAGHEQLEAERNRQAAERAVHEARAAWTAHRHAVTAVEVATNALASAGEKRSAAQRSVDDLAEDLGVAEEAARIARERVATATAAEAAATAAMHCQPGDPCPICTRPLPDTFTAPTVPDLTAAQHDDEAATVVGNHARAAASKARADLEHCERAVTDTTETLANARQSATAAATAAGDGGCDLDASDADQAVRSIVDQLTAATKANETATDRLGQCAEALVEAKTRVGLATERRAAELANAQKALDTAQRRVATQRSTADILPTTWRPASPVTAETFQSVRSAIDAMLRDHEGLTTDQAALVAARSSAETTQQTIRDNVAALVTKPAAQTLNSLNDRSRRVRDVASAAAKGQPLLDHASDPDLSPPETLSDEVDATNLAPTIAAAALVAQRSNDIIEAAARIGSELAERHRERTTEVAAELLKAGFETVTQLHDGAGEARARAVEARSRSDVARRAVAQARALDDFLDLARPFVGNLSVLIEALRDRHFVGDMVKIRETALISEASRRLRAITNGRFGFVADFGIVSLGSGEVRSSDTLSGGERFQAALALALSLVEIASRGSGRLEAVFVDEGFGSLDSAALEMALDTLGTVAGGGKMVALISHLRPVAEYVETVLLVTKDDTLGSKITVLDADARDTLLSDDIRSGLTA